MKSNVYEIATEKTVMFDYLIYFSNFAELELVLILVKSWSLLYLRVKKGVCKKRDFNMFQALFKILNCTIILYVLI